jgi:hypothetical protein
MLGARCPTATMPDARRRPARDDVRRCPTRDDVLCATMSGTGAAAVSLDGDGACKGRATCGDVHGPRQRTSLTFNVSARRPVRRLIASSRRKFELLE